MPKEYKAKLEAQVLPGSVTSRKLFDHEMNDDGNDSDGENHEEDHERCTGQSRAAGRAIGLFVVSQSAMGRTSRKCGGGGRLTLNCPISMSG